MNSSDATTVISQGERDNNLSPNCVKWQNQQAGPALQICPRKRRRCCSRDRRAHPRHSLSATARFLGIRAALTTIQIIEDDGLVENVGTYALDRLKEMQSRYSIIGDVRGLGMIMGIEIVQGRTDKTPNPEAADRILYNCLENGLSFKTSMGNVLTFYPPLITSKADIDHAFSIIEAEIAQES